MAAGPFMFDDRFDTPQSKFKRNRKMSSKLFWLLRSGPVISVPWPRGWINPHNFSTDPNDHYRPELERVVGIQGKDWDWRLDPNNIDHIQIKFLQEKAEYATIYALKWM